jgi:hypothetical protein
MAAGHRHDGERAASALADKYLDTAAPVVAACTVDRSYDVPWLANRTRDLKTVWVDRRVPKILKCGINTDESLPWHELPEGQAMDDGMPYDEGDPNAHCDVATPLERRNVESQKPDDPEIWKKYTDEMDGFIRAVDDETIERVPLDMDLRVFADDDRALLEKIMAKQAEEKSARRFRMPSRLITPLDMMAAVKGLNVKDPQIVEQLETSMRNLFYDGGGHRIAKAVGISASVVPSEVGERAVDFTISTTGLDRYNSTIDAKGWQLDNYGKNSVVLWAHDDSIPAIARGENTRIDGESVRSRAVFASRDVHPLADTIHGLIRGNFISAASVGWIPLKWQFVEEEGRGFGVDYLEQELLEWSVVNIPANPECLVDARSMGIDTKPLMTWASRTLDLGGLTAIPREELEKLRKMAGTGTATGFRAPATDRFKELFTEAIVELCGEKRSGKVLSAENKKKLEACVGHLSSMKDHCSAAMDHCSAILESCRDAEDGDPDDGGDGGGEAAAADAEQRARRVRVLKLRAPAPSEE